MQMEKPEFISEEVYASDFTRGSLDKLFRISAMKVTSFISKCELLGSPVPYRSPKRHEGFSVHTSKVYSCSEVIDRALSDGFEILPTQKETLLRTEEQLRGDIDLLRAELSILEHRRKDLGRVLEFNEIAFSFGLKNLYSEQEIVASSRLYSDLDRACGVYFLIDQGEVVYVGQSVNVFSRMREHCKSKSFNSYSYINCPREDLNVLESLYIHVLRPPLQGKSSQGDSLAAPISLSRLLKMGRRDA
jgi:hypothetical protein